MLQLRRVLHPTDFSDGARAAFAHALHLARAHGAALDVMHVAPLLGFLPVGAGIDVAAYPSGYEGAYVEAQEESLHAYVRAAGTVGVDVRVVPTVVGGPVAREILDHARAAGADLIVMGTNGRSGLGRFVMGSIAEAVVREALCPVLTVQARPEGAERPTDVRRIAAAVDFNYFAEDLVRHADALAACYPGASVALVHVVDSMMNLGVAKLGFEQRGRALASLEAGAWQQLEALRLRVARPATPFSYHVSSGFAPDEVLAAIERMDPDIVVTASRGPRGIMERMLLGSVTERILRGGHRATLVVKPAGRPVAVADEPDAAGANPDAPALVGA